MEAHDRTLATKKRVRMLLAGLRVVLLWNLAFLALALEAVFWTFLKQSGVSVSSLRC